MAELAVSGYFAEAAVMIVVVAAAALFKFNESES
jgi:hypothetical protein